MKKLNIFLSSLFLFVFFLSVAGAEQTEIRVLYVNDFHGFAEPYKPVGSGELTGGIAYLASAVEQFRKEKPSILLAAGDMIQGNNWANLFQGEPVVQVMNAVGFDAMVVGNHEFDFGQDVLKKRISEAHFPVLGANVEGFGLLKPYVIKELNNIRIAVIGIVTEDAPVSTHPRNVAGLKFLPPSDIVKKYLHDLKGKADVFIVLSHIGYYADRSLAENVKGIDIIVGGHSHTKLDRPVVIGNTIIVQAWEHAKALGMLDLTFENGKIVKYDGRLDEITPRLYKPDASIQKIVESYNRKLDGVLNEVIGEAAFDLDGENVRKKETNLGDLIADIIRQESGADLAIINGGSIRASIKKGVIRVEDVYSVLPFDNYIVAIKITGRQIKEALEHGVSGVERGEGRFPQVSGIVFTYSLSGPVGSRVEGISVSGKPIDPDKEYTVATNDFLATGGDGYKAFGDAIKSSKDFSVVGGMMKGEKLVYSDAGRWLRDVVIGYIKSRGKIAPSVEGRITEIP